MIADIDSVIDYDFEQLGLAVTPAEKLEWLGIILYDLSLDEIQEKIAEHSQGWNGDIGKGCQIMSRVLYQL